MANLPQDLQQQLFSLIAELREESADFLQHHEDAQQWYNRGYANGMVKALQSLLGEPLPENQQLDDPQFLQGNEVMAWGKAYRHGEQMGEKETYEIAGKS